MKNLLPTCLLLLMTYAGYGQKPELMVPIGHTQGVRSVAFSPDGERVLTGSYDNTAILWDLDGNMLQQFAGHTGSVESVAFSLDGKRVLTGGGYGDNTAILWNINGDSLRAFVGHMDYVSSVAFSPDGERVLTGSWDNMAILWDINGDSLRTFTGHMGGVRSVAFSPDGERMLTGSGTAILWDVNGDSLRTFAGHEHGTNSVAFSPDGERVLTHGSGTAVLWGVNGDSLRTFEMDAGVFSVAFSPDGERVLTHGGGTAILWDVNGDSLRTFEMDAGVFSVAFSPDGERVLTSNLYGTAILWDLDGTILQQFAGHTDGVNSVAFSPDGERVLTRSSVSAILWDINGDSLQTFEMDAGVNLVAFSPDGEGVLTRSKDGTVILWDVNGDSLQTFAMDAGVNSVAFSPDGERVLTRSSVSAILWDINGDSLQTFEMDAGVYSVAFSPDGEGVLTGSKDGTVILWDVNGDSLRTFAGHKSYVTSVAFSPDGEQVLMVNVDVSAILWDINGDSLRTFAGHTGGVYSAAFSPDGEGVLTGSKDGTVILWDVNGDSLRTFVGHRSYVFSVAFSPDGERLLTGSGDHTTKLWNAKTGQEIATLIQVDRDDWIVTTPSGLFDASPGAMSLMHYSVFYEAAIEYVAIEVEQLKARYYEPGLLQKLMGFSDERLRPVEDFDEVKLYPKVVKAEIDKDTLFINLKARNGGIGRVSIFINGKEVVEEVNPLPRGENAQRDSLIRYDLRQHQNFLLRHPDSTNTVSIRVYNEEGWLKSQSIDLDYSYIGPRTKGQEGAQGSKAWEGTFDPKLYVVTIGTSDYSGSKLDLQYADQDASMMAKALHSIGVAQFSNDSLEVHCFTTANSDSTGLEGTPIQWQYAGKDKIEATFKDLRQKAKAEDILVVYLSGHGVTRSGQDETQFYYLTEGVASEESLSDPATLRAYTISSEELTKWINDIPALKQVLIIDACNSGQIVENLTSGTKSLNSSQIRALDRMKDRTGMFVLSGSASDKVSYEAGEFGQGLLTYALLQGMRGTAIRKTADGDYVDVMKLFQHARDEVPRLAASINGIQSPMLGFPSRASSFDIGILNEQAKKNIPIGNKKPVVIRSSFFNSATFKDNLKLSEALELAFREETEKGSDADYIYVDVNDYPGAVSLGGLYHTEDDKIANLQVRLFVGDKDPIDLKIRASDNVKFVIRSIVKEMKEVLASLERNSNP